MPNDVKIKADKYIKKTAALRRLYRDMVPQNVWVRFHTAIILIQHLEVLVNHV